MAPFRPTYLNKRAYPGNANIVGPTCTATLGFSTTTCCSSTGSCGSCAYQTPLGCRCFFCAQPCCFICCSCLCTVCTQSVPGGMWSASEQYEASTRNAWGSNVFCTTGAATCLCCTSIGYANVGNITDNNAFYICCGPTTNKWFVAPSSTQVSRTWSNQSDAVTVANAQMGSLGWFVPTIGQILNPGYCCRTYWDSYSPTNYVSSSSRRGGIYGCFIDMSTGTTMEFDSTPGFNNTVMCVRAFRCTAT